MLNLAVPHLPTMGFPEAVGRNGRVYKRIYPSSTAFYTQNKRFEFNKGKKMYQSGKRPILKGYNRIQFQ
jgi:hypothetical protein